MKLTELLSKIEGHKKILKLAGLRGNVQSWLIARLARGLERPIVLITDGPERAGRAGSDLSFFTDAPILIYQRHDSPPFTPIVPSHETMAERVSTLYRMTALGGPYIAVVPIQALLEFTIQRDVLMKYPEYIEEGERTDRDALISWLIKTGYDRTSSVRSRGEFNVRGGILDVFPPSTAYPVRIDFFGDTVEEMRLFDPASQRSVDKIKDLTLLPAGEIIFDEDIADNAQKEILRRAKDFDWSSKRLNETLHQIESKRLGEGLLTLMPLFYRPPSSIRDYIRQDSLLALEEPDALMRSLEAFTKDAREGYEIALRDMKVLSPLKELVVPEETIKAWIRDRAGLILSGMDIEPHYSERPFGIHPSDIETMTFETLIPDLPPVIKNAKKGGDLLGPVFERLKSWVDNGSRVIISTPGERRGKKLLELFSLYDWMADFGSTPIKEAPVIEDHAGAGLEIYCGGLSSGFSLPSYSLVVITEDEIIGSMAHSREPSRKKKRTKFEEIAFEELRPGDFVVHRDHGIGIYKGLVRLTAAGVPGEYLHLEYRDQDKLYLPVDRLELIQHYAGIEGKEPRLDRLCGSTWQLVKQKVKKAVHEVAHELVELYAERMVRNGHAFSPPDAIFRQFEASFPHEETDDQAASVEEIISDMEKPRPMDRLLCGDVGYGKTEVAMRAAFKAAEDGKQTAVLVPTTLLAEQHERTFRQRFSKFPVDIAALSRLKSRQDQKEILKKTEEGAIDILIGTHRLLHSDVRFKDLGLLIIDEEHRFGVRHKERLKRLKQTVDCLTLTATPIPRTLQLSLLGLRDMSVINTPPGERLPVKTYLAEFDESLIRDAINREINRNGQVFFVHNKVKGIERIADHIRRLVPGARVETAHGQMDAEALEDIMIRFVRGEIDCLACTTIIESGIDIPSANTMIIDRADSLGIADLYQLRGRIGRSNEQAYCYLMVPRIGDLAQEPAKRLKAVMDATTSGGGFRLAMEDLRLRGAGNIVGVSQSGHIEDVGHELYLDLLQSAVEEIKGEPVKEMIDPEVNLGVPAFIPEDYVPDVEERLRLYRRLSRLENDSESAEFSSELEDRFGQCPAEVLSILEVMAIKRILKAVNCIRLDRGARSDGADETLILAFGPEGPPNTGKLIEKINKNNRLKALPDGRLLLKFKKNQAKPSPLEDIRHRLTEILAAPAGN